MQLLKATVYSWLATTIIYLVALINDGSTFNFKDFSGLAAFTALVGFIVAVYFAIFGLPLLYYVVKRPVVTRKHFIANGIAASVPMLMLTVFAGEPEFILATVIAGLMAGYVYSLVLCNQAGT